MPRQILASLVPLLTILSCSAPSPSAFPPGGRLFLWKVSSPSTEALILGDVGPLSRDPYPLPSVIEDGFQKAAFLVVASDAAKLDPERAKELVAERGVYLFNGDGLFEHLRPETAEALRRTIKENGLSLSAIERTRPWLLSNSLRGLRTKTLKYTVRPGLGIHFEEAARKGGKQIVGLESPEASTLRLAELSEELQDELLRETIGRLDGYQEQVDACSAYWFEGNLDGMERERIRKPLETFSGRRPLQAKLIDEVNEQYSKSLADLLGGKESFFAVLGVDHLLGTTGLLHLLREKGLKVDQMNDAPPPTRTLSQ